MTYVRHDIAMTVNDRKSPVGISPQAQTAYSMSSTDLPMHADMHANPFDMHPDDIRKIPLELYGMYTAVHCCNESAVRSADPSTIHGLDYGSRIFSVRIRNRCSVTDTDQRRNLDCRIFRKSFKKKVRENIRILLRKDYMFYFRFFIHIILQVFPGLFPVFFPDSFSKNCSIEIAEPSAGKCPVGIFRMSQDLSQDSYGSFPRQ